MRLNVILGHLGRLYLFNSIFLIIASIISIVENESSVLPLAYSALISLLFGLFPSIFVPKTIEIKAHEGVFVVVFGWITTCIIGMLPFLLWGGEFSLINAWFETVSGFTTTGSTVLNNIEALPDGLLFWRSATHWIGGIGIILFALLIVPATSQSKMVLYNTEMSSIAKENFQFRTRETLRILLYVYLGLTALEIVLLWVFGMSLFDAVNHAFATIATGGFSTKNASVAYFDNVAVEVIIMVFMVVSGIHFGLIFNTIRLRKPNIFHSQVVNYYIGGIIIGILLISYNLYKTEFDSFGEALRYGSFQVISLSTTTGFANYDSAGWPAFSKILLLFFTLQCACAGSTSGGLKADRILIFFKSVINQIRLLKYPRGIFVIRMKDKTLDNELVMGTMIFIVLYIVIVLISTMLLALMDVDLMTGFSASAATMGNVGPGFGNVSSLGNFAGLPSAGKFILSINMFLGRLEIYGLLSLFMSKF